MSTLTVNTWTMPAGRLGPDSPLPPIVSPRDQHAISKLAGYDDATRDRLAYGRVQGPLPYALQNDYDHDLQPREFTSVVLENEHLRAMFIPELGGRLWSLVHTPSGRELLSANPVFKPVNFAIRGAWFSGGVEWNIGTIGHCPFTCSPLFAGIVNLPGGGQALRMYEYERLRGTPFQVDAFLPHGSPVLFLRMRIVNPHDEDVPMYWWSNAAVPESPGTRLIVPADSAIRYGYSKDGLNSVPVPMLEGRDVSYPLNIDRSMDFFYNIPAGTPPWEVAMDSTGKGMVMASTDLLRGRKMFLWGNGAGGRHWQKFLSDGSVAYIETQAGLAPTQTEHVRMPAGTDWTWLEAYGLIEADPQRAHGDDWHDAIAAVQEKVDLLAPATTLADELEKARRWLDTPPSELIQTGSGWGALEEQRRARVGLPPASRPGTPFVGSSLGESQQPWLQLLDGDRFPERRPDSPPDGFVIGDDWRARLEAAVGRPATRDNWFGWLHLGVMRRHAGDTGGARDAWERSVVSAENAWALRNLAVLDGQSGDTDKAAARYARAVRLAPDCLQLQIEAGKAMIEAGQAHQWRSTIAGAAGHIREHGRLKLLQAEAALACGDLGACKELLLSGFRVEDLREGERSLSDLWFALQEKRLSAAEGLAIDDVLRERVRRDCPLPAHLDFRMSGA